MNPHRLRQLVASVPESIDAAQRARLLAHVQASDSCRTRADRLRAELQRGLSDADARPDRVVDLACVLDSLERVQERLDSRLTGLVEELTHIPQPVAYDDGVPA